MPEPGFFDETHWSFAIQFDDEDGNALDLTGKEQLLAILYDKHGDVKFRWLAAGSVAHEGTIDVSDIATGLIVLEATTEQHENVEEGKAYTWTLYDIEDPADWGYLANGTAYIGRAGEQATSFHVLNSYDGSNASAVVVGIKGDKGDDGDITPELEELRQETFTARDEAQEAAADAAASAIDAASEAEQALAARIGAEAAETAAELAAAAAAALGGPIYVDVAAGLAGTVSGEAFVVQGPEPDGGLIIYRNIGGSPEDAVQIGTLAGSGEVADLDARVDAIEPLTTVITTYLDPEPQIVPRYLGEIEGGITATDDYWDITDPDNPVHFSPETIRLDKLEAVGIAGTDVIAGYNGRVELTEDGSVTQGIRDDDEFFQYGPAPEREMSAEIVASRVIVLGEGITPFCVSGEMDDTNRALRHIGYQGIKWFNETASEFKTFNFLPGIRKGALLSTVTKFTALMLTGQSTSNGTDAVPVVTATCPETGKIVMFDVTPFGDTQTARGTRILGHEQGPTRLDDLVDLTYLRELIPAHESQEANNGESQCSQAAYEYQARMGADYGVLTGTVGIGSTPYSGIAKGTAAYSNLMNAIRRGWAIAKMRDLEFDVIIGWPQHEGNVTSTQAQYLGFYTEFQSDVTEDVALITDGEVTNVLFITNGFTKYGTSAGRVYTEQGLAQLQFALENPTKGVYATPCFTLHRGADGTHFTNVGNARGGSYFGRVASNLKLGRDALPLYTTAVGIDAGTIRGQLHLPWAHGTLTTSSPWVTDPGDRGFNLVRVDTQVAVPITSVEITGGNEWVLTPTAPPAGVPLEVSHGFRGPEGEGGGPLSGARCPINDDNPELDFFGNPFPNHLAAQRFFVTF